MKNLLDDYFTAHQEILGLFDYDEEWHKFPLDDCRDYYWLANCDQVVYSQEPLTEESITSGRNIYGGENRTGKHYRTEQYMMICVDTYCDNNILLMIFDNAKEQKDKNLLDFL